MRTFKNRKAEYNYYIAEEYEAGIVLQGSEIKSIRKGKVNFKDSFARIDEGEIWLYNLHISGYDNASYFNHEPERKRKLLLNRREIRKLRIKTEEKGYTLVPTELYINDKGIAKIKLALARGKKRYDKRETLQKKEDLRNIERRTKLEHTKE